MWLEFTWELTREKEEKQRETHGGSDFALMNDLEAEDDKDQWVDSEADLASEAYSSDSDDTDAEVPEVTDPVAAATSTIVQGSLPSFPRSAFLFEFSSPN